MKPTKREAMESSRIEHLERRRRSYAPFEPQRGAGAFAVAVAVLIASTVWAIFAATT